MCSLWWRHNDHDSVSNHQPHECLLNRLFRRRSKKTSKLRVTGLCVGNSPGPVNSPHKGPVTRKMFPFDDVIMFCGDLHWGPFQSRFRPATEHLVCVHPNFDKMFATQLCCRGMCTNVMVLWPVIEHDKERLDYVYGEELYSSTWHTFCIWQK